MVDFFISRAGEDQTVAKVIDRVLRAHGYKTFIQDNDFGHSDFVAKMDEGFMLVDRGARIIAVLSRAYISKPHCMKEARYVLTDDPSNLKQKLILLKIDDCTPEGLLKSVRYVDISKVLNQPESFETIVLQSVANTKNTIDVSVQTDGMEKILLLLETKDEEKSEKAFDVASLGMAGIATLFIAFEFALDAWNYFFETSHSALFGTFEVIGIFIAMISIISYGWLSEIKSLALTIEKSKLTTAELRRLRDLVAKQNWNSPTLMRSAVALAIKNSTEN